MKNPVVTFRQVFNDLQRLTKGLLVGFKSSHLSFAAPTNFHCVWLFANVNR